MLATLMSVVSAICSKLNFIGNVLGAIAFLFNISKIYNFIVSFYYLRKFSLKTLSWRFSLGIDEMRIVNEFLENNCERSFLFFTEEKKDRRRVYFSPGGYFRLPTVKERTALISLQNKGLIVQRKPFEKFSTSEEIDRDVCLADSVVTDLFLLTFK